MPPKSSHYRMADRLAGGELEHILQAFVDEGRSPGAIASRLFADYGIEVTDTTVSKWLAPPPVPKAEAS